jgi:hypothetical protein
VPELGPLTVAAHTRGQAEYLIRSRAEQRGVRLRSLEVSEAGHDVWSVVVEVDDADADKLALAALDQDTQVMHIRNHPSRRSGGT